jgi:hypothetical protein
MPDDIDAREAQHGKRMIEIQVRFWTDQIAEGRGHIQPKHAWDSGVIKIQRNDAHGITPGSPVPFNGLIDMASKIEKVLIQQGIKVHLSPRQRKYLVCREDT